MIWNIISIVLSVLGIGVSVLCWRFAYSNVKKYNKYVSQLYDVDFSKEGSFQKFNEIVKRIYELEKSEQKLQINLSHQKYLDGKIAKEDVVACLYNVYMNVCREYDKQKNDKKSGN